MVDAEREIFRLEVDAHLEAWNLAPSTVRELDTWRLTKSPRRVAAFIVIDRGMPPLPAREPVRRPRKEAPPVTRLSVPDSKGLFGAVPIKRPRHKEGTPA